MHGPLPLPATHHVLGNPSREIGRVAVFLFLLAFVARAATFGNPVVGYDEQFYLLVGDRMWDGAMPYVDIFDRKPIGLFFLYAAARLIPLEPFLAYKLLAMAFLVAGALGVYHLARRATGSFGAVMAASVFILWHNFMGGEGGQSPVFYTVFMLMAAALVIAAIDRPERVRRLGMGAMFSVGLAIQIKYCTLFEGIYFGCMLIWIALRAGGRLTDVAASALLWIGAALAPTLAVLGIYAAMGHAELFIFDNFLSAMGQGRNGVRQQLRDLLEIVAILAPLLVILGVGIVRGMTAPDNAARRFVQGWLLASAAGLLLFWRFNHPHYALPLLAPLCILIAPIFDAKPRRPLVSVALLLAGLVIGQLVLHDQVARHGGADAAQKAAQAALAARETAGADGCIYVYAGYPALYMLTDSCLPSRWSFPGSLNMKDEEKATAIGVDPAVEVRRIMAARPPVVVDEYPRSPFGNQATRAVLDQVLARDYELTACPAGGEDGVQLVYRLRAQGAVQTADLGGEAAHCMRAGGGMRWVGGPATGPQRAPGTVDAPPARATAYLRAAASASASTAR